MAASTRQSRISSRDLMLPWRGVFSDPSFGVALDAADRAVILNMYDGGGTFAPPPSSMDTATGAGGYLIRPQPQASFRHAGLIRRLPD